MLSGRVLNLKDPITKNVILKSTMPCNAMEVNKYIAITRFTRFTAFWQIKYTILTVMHAKY